MPPHSRRKLTQAQGTALLAQAIENGARELGNTRSVGAADVEKAIGNFQAKFERELSPDTVIDVMELLRDPSKAVVWNSTRDSLKSKMVERFVKQIERRRDLEGM